MIKDSKLIGTKIKVPFGWRKFKVGELFDVIIPSDSPSDLVDVQDKYHSIPLIKAQTSNHGISGYSSGEGCYIFHSGLTIGMRGSFNVYVHINDVILGNNVAGLALKYNYGARDEYSLVYISSVISKLYAQASGYIGYPTMHKLMYDDIIELPVTADDQPDFDWMSDYIKAVKADYLEQKALSNQNEIKAYLSAGNVDSTDITDDDLKFLKRFEALPRKDFKLGDLFDHIVQGRRLKKSDHITGNFPFIMSGTTNTGIADYIGNSVEHFPSNSITIDIFGNAFYRDYEYGMGDDTGAYWNADNHISKFAMLFITAVLNKSLTGTYTYGHKLRSSRAIDLSIKLPVCSSSDLDFSAIEKYMQIQSKPLINNVVKTLVPVGGGATLIDFVTIEKYMQIQIKLTIGKHAKHLDKELALMRTV